MKRANGLRTLEELWDLEDRYPLANPSATGLLRWMAATGILPGSSSSNRRSTPKARSRRRKTNGS